MRISFAVGLVCLGSFSFAADPAHAALRKDLSIPSEPLGAALADLAKSFDFQLLYHTELVQGLNTQGAAGSLTSDEALSRVLSGTGLTYKYLASNTVTVYAPATSGASGSQPENRTSDASREPGTQGGGKKSSQDFRLAQVAQGASAGAAPVGVSSQPTAENEELNEVVVTGTRTSGLRAVDSPAPVQYLSNDLLTRVGQPDLTQSLSMSVPSLQAQQYGNDAAQFNKSFRLRGVSPNETLVLVDGTRRHGTANLNVFGGPFVGNAATDLNFIPIAAIDHVEVLQDGAAAQYGSDAIAGVINIFLKKADSGGSVSVEAGHDYDQGGLLGEFSTNFGLRPFEGAFLNVTLDARYQGRSFRGDVDPRVLNLNGSTAVPPFGSPVVPGNVSAHLLPSYPQIATLPNYPYLSPVQGDGLTKLYTGLFNSGYRLSSNTELYSFGSWGYKDGRALQAYRAPNAITDAAGTMPFSLGFLPDENIRETDYSFTFGGKGAVGDTTWNLASTYGQNYDEYWVLNTANAALYYNTGSTPTNIHAGDFVNSEWTNNFDVTRAFDVGLGTPLTLAGGAEYRENRYQLKAGELASYYSSGNVRGGSQGYFGFSPGNASDNTRHSYAAYLDAAFNPVEKLKIDAASRYEHYDDFGSAAVWKLTTRYDFNDVIAVRGTADTGFRAPTMAEEYYSGMSLGPTSVSGNFAPNSAGARFLGFTGLKPEKSHDYSFGVVTHFLPRLTMTLDAYSLRISNRIVQSGTIYGYNTTPRNDISPSVLQALAASGLTIEPALFTASNASVSITSFVNGADTLTRGFDFVSTYPVDYGAAGNVDYSLVFNYNKTEVEKINAPPANVSPNVILLDRIAVSNLEHTSPDARATAGAYWTLGKWGANLRETYYGSTWVWAQNAQSGAYLRNEVRSAWITDLQLQYKLSPALKLTLGANNLFNRYPNHTAYSLRQSQLNVNALTFAFSNYPTFSPYGFDGGFYFASATWSF